jgi:addiction module HigA family antidote
MNPEPYLTPGYILKTEFMEPLEITSERLARELGVAEMGVRQIIRGGRKITPDVAIRLSMFFGTTAGFWLNLQNIHDLQVARETNFVVYKTISPYQPVVEPLSA